MFGDFSVTFLILLSSLITLQLGSTPYVFISFHFKVFVLCPRMWSFLVCSWAHDKNVFGLLLDGVFYKRMLDPVS